jgi:hypothetical protein
MSFIVRNLSGGTLGIDDLGITLGIAEDYNLAQERPQDVAQSSDLPANITAGNVVVLDPLDGVTVLSVADAIELVSVTNDPHYRIRGGLLNQLDDVDTTGLVNGQGLQYNSTSGNFEVITPAGAQDIFATLTGDTGTITAASPTDTFKISGTTDQVTTTVAGNVLTAAIATNPIIPGTEGISIPSGTTAQRPISPTLGETRLNTTTGLLESWDGTSWLSFGAQPGNGVTELISGQLTHQLGVSTIPYDDTPPLITEGTQFFTQAVTTQTGTGRVVLWFSTIVSVTNANRIATISLFRDNGVDPPVLIGVTAIQMPSTSAPVTATFIVVDTPGVAGTYTYTGRIGTSAAATWRIGGYTSNANYGGAANTNNQYVLMRIE